MTPRNRVCLTLKDVRDVSVLCDGVEMICTETTRAISISNCVGVTVRGLSIDYDPLPFTQGRIVALSADKSVQDIELIDGYPRSDTATTFKYEIFRPDTRTYRCGEYDIETPAKPDPQHLRITRRGSNANDPEQVGDISPSAPNSRRTAASPTRSRWPTARACGSRTSPSTPRTVRLPGLQLRRDDVLSLQDGPPPARDRPGAAADPRIRSLNADAFHSICCQRSCVRRVCGAIHG